MKWLKEKLQSKKEGSTLVSVIIGLTFLVALGLIVVLGSSQYLTAVFVDNYAKDSFYDSETILEEVRTGLIETASSASQESYKDVMKNYVKYKGSVKNQYAKEFISRILSSRIASTGEAAAIKGIRDVDYTWDDADLEVIKEDGGGMVEHLREYTKVPTAVKGKDAAGNIGDKITYVIHKTSENLYTLTLKNVVIDYTDEAQYHSTIVTDIRMNVPDLNFENDSQLDAARDYIVISDDQIEIPMYQKSSFSGNIYTGNKENGIVANLKSEAEFYSDKLITRGNIQSKSRANVKIRGLSDGTADVWTNNITLDEYLEGVGGDMGTGTGTIFDMNANAHVAGDLEINDADTMVTLSGKYYGYSYNETNSEDDPANSKYSSAILINGYNTKLNASGLDLLELAGRTFVEKDKDDLGNAVADKESDIMMGESMAIKSNQIAYLVPDKYMVDQSNMYGVNPKIWEAGSTVDADSCVNIPDSDPIAKYLDSDKKFIKNVKQIGTANYTYYFLKFKNANMANQYFKDLYEGSLDVWEDGDGSMKERLNDIAETYIAPTSGGMALSSNLYLIAGNIINYSYKDDGSMASSKKNSTYYESSGKPKEDVLIDGEKMGKEYVSKLIDLLDETPSDHMHMTDADYDTPYVADKLLDFTKLTENLKIPENDADVGEEGRISTFVGNVSIDVGTNNGGKLNGLVIATGDVEVSTDFTGLIIAGGKVTAKNGAKLVNDQVMIGNLLAGVKDAQDGTTLGKIRDIFRNLDVEKDKSEVLPQDCVVFRNWTRE